MVSFSCEICSDILKKPKLDSHAARCRGAYYTCIDCSKTFVEGQWKGHTSCVSEAEKYQGSFYKPEKGKGKSGKEKDKKKKGSPEAIAAPVTEVSELEAKDTPMDDTPPAESPDQSKPSKKEKKKSKKDKKAKKDKKKSKDTPAAPETSPNPAPAIEAVDKKKRKSASAEDTPAKKKKKKEKGEGEKARMSQERLADLVGKEELGFAGFLERLEKEVGGAHDEVPKGAAFQGLRVKVDDGRVVLSFGG
ncbi:unnamed protein product [Tuber aestivum]|uniref:Zinc finger C2H2 LYAR-type domain-containing protein n=1 Tax=Tuber aestivum TaxID=59557 RepID=A0A292Q525_9PEZI|nr:unnamed protein product [Tuber aestivum]